MNVDYQYTKNYNYYDRTLLILSDMHSGSVWALTPPPYQLPINSIDPFEQKAAQLQQATWNWFVQQIQALGKIHTLVINGDCIEGRGERNGGAELLTIDRLRQVEIATHIIKMINADTIFMFFGTEYHGGKLEEFEKQIANNLGIEIYNKNDVFINGTIFNFRHKVGSAKMPSAKYSPLGQEILLNAWDHVYYGKIKADVIIRSHTHHFAEVRDKKHLCITTPALQLGKTQYGERQCSGDTDFGFIHFNVYKNGDYTCQEHFFESSLLIDRPLLG